jgi:acyl carrier protein
MDSEFLEIIAQTLKIKPKDLKEYSTVGTVPEWDSLNHWAIIAKIEDVYGVELTMEEAVEFKDLKDMYNILQNKLKKERNNDAEY